MERHVENAEREQGRFASHDPLEQGLRDKDEPVYVNIFHHLLHQVGGQRGLELWTNFLYGQSMIVPFSEWPEGPFGRVVADEYSALNWVYEIAQDFDHVEAMDASVDAIRQLLIDGADLSLTPKVLKSSPSESSLTQMLMDFVVYGGLDKDYTAFIDSRIAPIESFDGLTRWNIQSARARQPLDDYLRITNELCKMFNRKAEDAIAGRPLPDLRERCRYHSHGENNRACYLENGESESAGTHLGPA